MASDNCASFSCGSHELDRYLQVHALSNAVAGVSVTYVQVDESAMIEGYITLAGTSIRPVETSGAHNLPNYPLPALLLARLAVDSTHQRCGIGRRLLTYALEEALLLHSRIGCVAVVVDAKQEAVAFYERFGFEASTLASATSGTTRVVLEIGSILDALT